jgi:hypothetical protein
MTSEVFSLLLLRRQEELSEKALETGLTKIEQIELNALREHKDKTPAVAQRIRVLAARMAQPNRWGMLLLRFSRKFQENLAELESLVHYGHSKAVWEIAYLNRKRAARTLNTVERSELQFLTLFHDSPDVLRVTELKMKEEHGSLIAEEIRELSDLQRNLYRKGGIPNHLLEIFWSGHQPQPLDLRQAR